MTREDKQLLFKDLCARIPYDLVVNVKDLGDVYLASVDWWEEVGVKDYTNTLYPLDDIKPYLRSMSSMTDEEIDKMWEIYESGPAAESSAAVTEYLYERYLDCHHLIEKGLALEATKDMYKTE